MPRLAAFPVVCLLAAAAASEIRPGAAPAVGNLTTRFVAAQAIPASDGTHRKSVNVSLDGRFVAFESDARLAPQDTNTMTDVYALDRMTRTVTLESISALGGASDGSSGAPVLSADGRYLVFESEAHNLETVPDGNWGDVFLRDRRTRRTRRISIGAGGEAANGLSGEPTISADGGTIAFASGATNLLPGRDANGSGRDVYLFRLQTGALWLGNVGNDGAQPAIGETRGASLSGDGRFVAFVSTADLEEQEPHVRRRSGARGGRTFVRDTLLQTTECIDAALHRRHAEGFSYHPALSADARYVAFVFAAARPARPTRVAPQVYLYDRVHSMLLLVSRTMRGSPADGPSSSPALSADGGVVAFQSLSSNLGCGRDCPSAISDLNLLPDVYLFEAQSHRMVRLSRGPGEWWVPSVGPAIDGSGRLVAFSSRQPRNSNDVDSAFDLYVSAADERE